MAGFRKRFGSSPELVVRAPGRVNLIGEHVDYNEGFVLPMAIDRAVWIAASAMTGGRSTVVSSDLGEEAEIAIEPGRLVLPAGLPTWARYPAGVGAALAQAGYDLPAIAAVVASDVPMGAGLSSSAALEVGFAVSWRALGGFVLGDMDLAKLCQRAEAEAVGVRCGLMDQFASVHGQHDHALLLDCRSFDWRTVPLPPRTVVVVADTRVRRELAGSEFNLRRRQCEDAVRGLRRVLPGIASLRDVTPEQFLEHERVLPGVLARRARHVVFEIDRVARAIPAIERGEAEALGRAMTEAHVSGRDLYEVSCPELDRLVEDAVALEGCHGARLTGAGFGGCTVSLVDVEAAEEFRVRLAASYEAATGITPASWTCRAADGAEVSSPAAA